MMDDDCFCLKKIFKPKMIFFLCVRKVQIVYVRSQAYFKFINFEKKEEKG